MAKTVDFEIYGIEYWVDALDEDGEGFEGRSAFSVEDTTFCVDGKEYDSTDFEDAANLDSTDHINLCEDFDVRKFFIENEAVEGVLHTQKSYASLEIEIPDDEEFDPAKVVLVTYDWIFPDGDDYIMLHSVVYDGVQYDDTCPQDGRGIGSDTIWSAEDEEDD